MWSCSIDRDVFPQTPPLRPRLACFLTERWMLAKWIRVNEDNLQDFDHFGCLYIYIFAGRGFQVHAVSSTNSAISRFYLKCRNAKHLSLGAAFRKWPSILSESCKLSTVFVYAVSSGPIPFPTIPVDVLVGKPKSIGRIASFTVQYNPLSQVS